MLIYRVIYGVIYRVICRVIYIVICGVIYRVIYALCIILSHENTHRRLTYCISLYRHTITEYKQYGFYVKLGDIKQVWFCSIKRIAGMNIIKTVRN